MAIVVGNTTQNQSTGSSTLSFSVTVEAGTNLLLVAASSFITGTSRNPTSVTFNGTGLTKIPGASATNSFGSDVSFWYKENPTITTANVVVTYNTTMDNISGFATRMSGANSTQPDASNSATPTNADPQSVSLTTSADNSFIFSIINMNNNPVSSFGGSQTELGFTFSHFIEYTYHSSAITPGGTGVTDTYSSGGTDDSVVGIVSIAPTATSAPVSVTGFMTTNTGYWGA